MNKRDVILASHAAGEPVGPLPSDAGAELDLLRALCGQLRDAAPAPSRERRDALLLRLRPRPRLSLGWLAAAAGVLLVVGVLGFALSNRRSDYVPAPAAARAGPQSVSPDVAPRPGDPKMPAPGGEVKDSRWLDEQLSQVFARSGGERTGGDPPRMGGDSSGGSAPLDPEGLLPAVLAQAGFDCLYWPEGVDGMRLHSASVVRRAESGLKFDLVRIEYRQGDARLLLLQAPESEDAAARLAAVPNPNGRSHSEARSGVRLLLISNALSAERLQALAGQLSVLPE